MMPSSSENFEADDELEDLLNDGNEVEKKQPLRATPTEAFGEPETNVVKTKPIQDFPEVKTNNTLEPIQTPNHTTFEPTTEEHKSTSHDFGSPSTPTPIPTPVPTPVIAITPAPVVSLLPPLRRIACAARRWGW